MDKNDGETQFSMFDKKETNKDAPEAANTVAAEAEQAERLAAEAEQAERLAAQSKKIGEKASLLSGELPNIVFAYIKIDSAVSMDGLEVDTERLNELDLALGQALAYNRAYAYSKALENGTASVDKQYLNRSDAISASEGQAAIAKDGSISGLKQALGYYDRISDLGLTEKQNASISDAFYRKVWLEGFKRQYTGTKAKEKCKAFRKDRVLQIDFLKKSSRKLDNIIKEIIKT